MPSRRVSAPFSTRGACCCWRSGRQRCARSRPWFLRRLVKQRLVAAICPTSALPLHPRVTVVRDIASSAGLQSNTFAGWTAPTRLPETHVKRVLNFFQARARLRRRHSCAVFCGVTSPVGLTLSTRKASLDFLRAIVPIRSRLPAGGVSHCHPRLPPGHLRPHRPLLPSLPRLAVAIPVPPLRCWRPRPWRR